MMCVNRWPPGLLYPIPIVRQTPGSGRKSAAGNVMNGGIGREIRAAGDRAIVVSPHRERSR
jgi:hypothetical protein